MVLSWSGSVGGSSWAQAHGTHNAPLFPAREGSRPRLEQENVFDWPSMGNGEQLMLVCSNMNFLIFGFTFDVVAWDPLKAGGFYKRFGGWQIPLCHW